MEPAAVRASREVIGRESELSVLREFVLGSDARQLLVLRGGPGVGKTTLWQEAVRAAAVDGLRVLVARASEAETTLPFTTLADLVGDVDLEACRDLPGPQRRALEIALLRTESDGVPPEASAIALGTLNVLRSLCRAGPVLVAVDDVPWADAQSADALAFAARRLTCDQVRFLLARRPGPETRLEAAVGMDPVATLAVEGLSLGAMRRLLATRLGVSLSRRVMRQVFEATLGNPLFALEIGRRIVDDGPPAIGEDLPLPDSLEELLGSRGSGPPRRVLLAVALGGALTVAELEAAIGPRAVEAAVEARLVDEVDDRVRPAHPLHASAVLKRASPRERRELHRTLAGVVGEPSRRARHLALAQTRPDAGIAAAVALGAASALGRGATEHAVELAEYALRLTPAEAPERTERILTLADYLLRAHEGPRLRALLDRELRMLPPGEARARGHLLLSLVAESQDDYDRQLELAISESVDAPAVRARALAWQAYDGAVSFLEHLDEAEAKVTEAAQLVPAGRDNAFVRYVGAWLRALRGRPLDEMERIPGDPGDGADFLHSLERVEGIRLAFRGVLADARALFVRALDGAEERGQERVASSIRHQLCEIELRAGRVTAAWRLVEEMDPTEGAAYVGLRAHVARLRAVAAAVEGDPTAAERWAEKAHELVVGQRWDILEARRARGIAALAAGNAGRAVEELDVVSRHTEAEGIDDPGAFPVAADLVEAALAAGDLDLAGRVTRRLGELAEAQEHPWGLASAKRCRALLRLTTNREDATAREDLLAAAAEYGRLGLEFDAARTLLSLGRHERRRRKWGLARDALERSVERFQDLGCDGWANLARAELGALGGRPPRKAAALTPSEQRVAELAGQGMSNKEIAAALFVSVHTVEAHLSAAYRKLGVRSRAQVAQALAVPRTPKKD